jgi:ParB family chromosome partitioning protein
VKVKIVNVGLDEIDWKDDFFRISSSHNPLKMAQSISTVGLINHPYIIAKNNNFSIVSGFRRLSAYRYLKRNTISAKKIDSQTSIIECSKLAIADNSFQRSLNLIEQSRCYVLLNSVCKDEETFLKALSGTGLSKNRSLIAKISPLCRMPQSIQDGVEKGAVSLAVARMLLEIDEGSAIFMADLFQKLTLGQNKQREIFQMVFEIAKRDNLTPWELLHQESFQNIIEDKDLDKSKKAFEIRYWLKQQRYPNLSHRLKMFDHNIAQLKLGNRIRLTPPAYFEGKKFNLSLDFSTQKHLVDFRDKVRNISENKYLASLLD